MPPRTPHSPKEYMERDRAILLHVAEYRIGIREAINRLFGHGGDLGHVLARHVDEGLLVRRERECGGKTLFELSEKGAQRIGVPLSRAKTLKGVSLDSAISNDCSCCLSEVRKYPISASEVKELFPGISASSNHLYCVSQSADGFFVFRVFLSQGKVSDVVKAVRREIANATGTYLKAINSHEFQFLVLCDRELRKASLEAAFLREGLCDFVRVELSATSATLPEFLRSLRRKDQRDGK